MKWTDITKEDIIKAIEKFDNEDEKYPEAKCTFLKYNNKKYPAKHIRAMAYEIRFNKSIKKSEFTGGAETVRFFEKLGFIMDYTGKTQIRKNKLNIINNQELESKISENKDIDLKVGLYIQTTDFQNLDEFNNAMEIVKKSDIDILVLPEFSYTPFMEEIYEYGFMKKEDIDKIYDYAYELSYEINKAIIIGIDDKYGSIYTVYANAKATENETQCAMYIKHTMTEYSAFEINDYNSVIKNTLEPIIYKNIKIGMTICYDCNHSLFSRVYGIQDVDVILNSTGGNVVYDKWYKYNKVRAIENSCYNFITMGGVNKGENNNSYVYGFNRQGKELKPYNLMKNTDKLNEAGTIYVYDTKYDDGLAQVDTSIDQNKTANKTSHINIKIGEIDSLINESIEIDKNIYKYKLKKDNIILLNVKNEDILKPEKVLKLLYNDKLKNIENKKYIIVNKFNKLDKYFYETKLSSVLKVRAMENFCAVILESDIINNAYQTGKNRTAQVVSPNENNEYELDLERTSGPESIWKNKKGMKASYRDNFEALIDRVSNVSIKS